MQTGDLHGELHDGRLEQLMSEQVKVEILLDAEVAQWIDDLNKKLGLRSRGWVINKLLLEVRGEEEENENIGEERL